MSGQRPRPRHAHFACAATILVATALLAGCAFLSGKPPLPKRAAVEVIDPGGETDTFVKLAQQADIFYLPSEHLANGGRESALRLLQALQRTVNDTAVAWDRIDGDQQPLLDRQSDGVDDPILEQFNSIEGEHERDTWRAISRASLPHPVRHVALRCPDRVLARLRNSDGTSVIESGDLPSGFSVASGDFDAFAEQLHAGRTVSENELRKLYRVYIAAEQFAADRIVRHSNEHPAGKLLVILHRRHLDPARGVPQFVAQKVQRRQIVLEPTTGPAPARPDLVTSIAELRHSLVEIVDRAPAAAADHL